MNAATRRTLLARVRDPADRAAWIEFHGLYAPLLRRYARSLGLSRDDAEEVRDACLALLVQKMRTFEYRPERGRFKTWLRRIAHDKAVDLLRRQRPQRADTSALAKLPDPGSDPDQRFEVAWRTQELRRGLAQALRRVSRRDARAFRRLLHGEADIPTLCSELGLTANQIYKAKSRVLACVRALACATTPRTKTLPGAAPRRHPSPPGRPRVGAANAAAPGA